MDYVSEDSIEFKKGGSRGLIGVARSTYSPYARVGFRSGFALSNILFSACGGAVSHHTRRRGSGGLQGELLIRVSIPDCAFALSERITLEH